MTKTLTGTAAIDYAEARSLTLNKYADPVEDAREGLSVEEARKIAAEDPSLIWVEKGRYDMVAFIRRGAEKYPERSLVRQFTFDPDE